MAVGVLVMVAGALISAGTTSSGSTRAAVGAPSTYSILGNATPKSPADPDSRQVEVGVRFTTQATGWIVAIRYYQFSQATPSNRGTLWAASGAPMGRTYFVGTQAGTGWRTGYLHTPIRIQAGGAYVASYVAPKGHYAADINALSPSKPITSNALKADVGFYTYTGSMPRNTWRDANYFVDVVFTTVPPGGTPPTTTVAPPPVTTRPPAPATSPTPSPPSGTRFPTRATTGVPGNWTPTRSVTGNYVVSTAGAVVQDLRITNGDLLVNAPNVTIRRVEIRGGRINNFWGPRCNNGMLVENSTIVRAPGSTTSTERAEPAVGIGGYTARNVKIDGVPEGFRAGGKYDGCGPVVIENSFASISSPDVCNDWHGDSVQGYDGPALTIRNTTLEMIQRSNCGGTAPFFYPHSQGNTSVDIDGLLVKGGGYPFRLGMPGPVRNLNIVDRSWNFGPIDVKCSVVAAWSARIVTLDANGQPVAVRSQSCNTETGN